MSEQQPITFLCLASEFKGIPFIQEAKRQGCRVLLLVNEKFAGKPWPWDSIDEHFRMPELSKQPDVTYAVGYLARSRKLDRIIALDDYDVATAASLREHLRLPGMGESTARYFRDKLAMRVRAHEADILVPGFSAVFNDDDLRDFMNRVPPPWVLKPRFEAGAVGIRKLHAADQLWQTLESLGDQRSFYLLEQFVPGDVYHVDAIISAREVVFSIASKYGAPPLSITQGGGIFNTRTLAHDSEEAQTITQRLRDLMQALQIERGVTHTEFIRGQDGRFYFLETAARVGGANIDKLVEAATGIVLWAEAARLEIASVRDEPYRLPAPRQDHAGLIICLARQQQPDLSAYQDPEIIWRLDNKEHHAGLLVASPDPQRVEQLLTNYNQRFAADFLAVGLPKTEVRHNI
ncbi:MAG TPA: ATP-grasp domain-containing protein [Anaerolineae bacterium]